MTKKQFSLFLAFLALVGCAAVKPAVKTVYDVAVEACVASFGAKKPGMSATEVAKNFCQTAEDLQPFVDSILSAQHKAAMRHHAAE